MYLYCYFLHRNNNRLNPGTNPYNISVTQQRLSLVSLGYLWRTASETNTKQQFCTCVIFFQLHFFAIIARQRHHLGIFLSLSKLDAVPKSRSIGSSWPTKPFPIETPLCRDPIRKTAVSYATYFATINSKNRTTETSKEIEDGPAREMETIQTIAL